MTPVAPRPQDPPRRDGRRRRPDRRRHVLHRARRGAEEVQHPRRHGRGLVREAGLKTAILTRESTQLVERRGAKLKIDHVFIGVLGQADLHAGAPGASYGLTLEQVAYIGDDVNDYELLCHVGLAVAVRDASRLPKSVAHLVTEAKGGEARCASCASSSSKRSRSSRLLGASDATAHSSYNWTSMPDRDFWRGRRGAGGRPQRLHRGLADRDAGRARRRRRRLRPLARSGRSTSTRGCGIASSW